MTKDPTAAARQRKLRAAAEKCIFVRLGKPGADALAQIRRDHGATVSEAVEAALVKFAAKGG